MSENAKNDRVLNEHELALAAKLKEPLPNITGCPFCGSDRLHRHGSDPDHLVLTHTAGCLMGRLTVMRENSDKHKAWETRKA